MSKLKSVIKLMTNEEMFNTCPRRAHVGHVLCQVHGQLILEVADLTWLPSQECEQWVSIPLKSSA